MGLVERKVMAALVRRGHYPETPAGFAKAIVDAQDIVKAWRESNGGPTAVAIAVGRAVHGLRIPPTEAGRACFHADQDAVWEVFHGTYAETGAL